MIVYRITNSLYKDDISGNGSKLFGARWNEIGYPMLYTSQHISLCALEMLVNISLDEIQLNYHLLHIEIPDNLTIPIISAQKLKKNWQDDFDYTKFMGTAFLKNNESLILQVPSSIIFEEANYLINPMTPLFKKVKIKKVIPFTFDKRLIRTNG